MTKYTDQPGDVIDKPWGEYEVLVQGDGFQVKRLTIDPGHRTSLQSHEHRKEQWTVVAGVLTVERGWRTQETVHDPFNKEQYPENSLINIPEEMIHRASNEGDEPATFIEVQFGNNLQEDDIIRYEDDYDR